jgi:transposase-like protein
MELKEAGLTYEEIAAELDLNKNTIAGWFSRSELFNKKYEQFKEDLIRETVENGKKQLKRAVDDAVNALVEIVNYSDNDHARIRAAEDILDRSGLEAASKVKQDVKQEITDGKIEVQFFSDREDL